MNHPKWWEFWKGNVTDEDVVIEHHLHVASSDNAEIGEPLRQPIREIVRLMIKDRKRFVVQKDTLFDSYTILDLVTGEEFSVFVYTSAYFDLAKGIDWATKEEIIWAFNQVTDHYNYLNRRVAQIKNARERNRLIEIYA